MALTTGQEAHIGRFLNLLVQQASTPKQLGLLEDMMKLFLPAGKRYVTNGNLGTQAQRLAALTQFRDDVYEKTAGISLAGNAAQQHLVANHYHANEDDLV